MIYSMTSFISSMFERMQFTRLLNPPMVRISGHYSIHFNFQMISSIISTASIKALYKFPLVQSRNNCVVSSSSPHYTHKKNPIFFFINWPTKFLKIRSLSYLYQQFWKFWYPYMCFYQHFINIWYHHISFYRLF